MKKDVDKNKKAMFFRNVLLVAIIAVFLFNTFMFLHTYGGGFTGLSINEINKTVSNATEFSPLPSKIFMIAQASILLIFGVLIKSKRKSQASIEFMSTYGWMILVLVIAIGALGYFGIFNKLLFGVTVVNSPFYLHSWNVQGPDETVNFEMINKEGDSEYEITKVEVDVREGADSCTAATPGSGLGSLVRVSPTERFLTTIQCQNMGSKDEIFKGYIKVTYKKVGSAEDLVSTGIITEKIADESEVPCVPNGCGGGCPLNCDVFADPDCGCVNGDGCCPEGCEGADDDCEIVFVCNPETPEGFAGGDGSVEDPYQICDCGMLQTMELYPENYFTLTCDIECGEPPYNEGDGFMPVGIATTPFIGGLNGQGHNINNLFISRSQDNVGLFGYVGSGANIVDVNVVSASFSISGERVGALAGSNEGVISNSFSSGSISSNYNYVGGLVGYNTGFIEESSSSATVFSTSHEVGGLVGWDDGGSITNSYATGNVDGEIKVGGLVGETAESTYIEGCYATGTVTGSSSHPETDSGGLVGLNYGYISDSYSTGAVSGYEKIGGLVGRNYGGQIEESFSSSSVSGTYYVGGFAGIIQDREGTPGLIYNSHSEGPVSGDSYLGGLVGWIDSTGIAETSYSTSSVSGNYYVGGFAGQLDGSIHSSYSTGDVFATDYYGGFAGYYGGSIIDSYWYNNVGDCYYGGSDPGCVMAGDYSDFYDSSYVVYNSYYMWDFSSIWLENPTQSDYPTLRNIVYSS